MKRLAYFLPFLLLCSFQSGQKPVHVVQFDAVEAVMEREGVQVINFWATWCRPCVKELPYFEQARQKFEEQGVGFTLVSLDFATELETKVIPFVKKREIGSEVLLLDNTDYDTWIHKVSEGWDGAIPATLILNKRKNKVELVVGELSFEELNEKIVAAL